MTDRKNAQAVLESIQIGLPRSIDDPAGTWISGIWKSAVSSPIFLDETNLRGDGQADLKHHGGPDRAVLAYSADHYPDWRRELELSDIPFGWFGENLTIAGLNERSVCIGDLFSIGAARLRVSQPRQPCWKLGRRTGRKDLPARVVETARGGWYLRVLRTGTIQRGLSVDLLERPHPDWPVSHAFEVANRRPVDRQANLQLSRLPALSGDWRTAARKRAGIT